MLPGYVEIDRLRVHAHHGVMAQEREVGNLFEVSVRLLYDMEQAAESDDVVWALNYADLAAVVKEEMAVPSNLLENVVLRLRKVIRARFPAVLGGSIKIAKLTPPIPGQMASVSISTEW